MGRKRKQVWRWRLAAAALFALLLGGAWGWWEALRWTPPRADFPGQGVIAGEAEGPLTLSPLRAARADFVYLEASRGADGRDPTFAHNITTLAGSGIMHGVVHTYDPCVPAERQAANFVTIVPRDATLLPPAISLDKPASACGDPVVEAALESELTTFINQV